MHQNPYMNISWISQIYEIILLKLIGKYIKLYVPDCSSKCCFQHLKEKKNGSNSNLKILARE